MSSAKKQRNDNLTVVVAKLLKRVARLEETVASLQGGQPVPEPEAIDAPPAPAAAPSNLPPGVRRQVTA